MNKNKLDLQGFLFVLLISSPVWLPFSLAGISSFIFNISFHDGMRVSVIVCGGILLFLFVFLKIMFWNAKRIHRKIYGEDSCF
tara:strand:- start:165 stop:413 length:249 start_codon:yes stop_codon:yes gene_type:complete